MPVNFTLPPDTRAVGTGNPAGDMNGVVDAVASLGGPGSVLNTAFGTADPLGGADSTAAFVSAKAAAIATGMPMLIPSGSYKITSALDWKGAGLNVIGAGSNKTFIIQQTANVPVVMAAGQEQRISGLRLGYATQQANTSTNAICLQLGDDTAGNCFMSHFSDLMLHQGAYGMRINPALTATSGLFSCQFDNNRVLGWSISAIALEAAAATGASNCTGCVFNNTYLHNNNTGSPANSLLHPVFLHSWDEVVFNQLNVEHSNVFTSDVIQLQTVGNAVFNSLHLEALQLSGASGNSGYFSIGSNSSVVVNGMSVRFSTLTGSSNNPVVRFFGGTSKFTLTGMNETSDVTVGGGGVHPWVNFASNANCTVAVSGVVVSQVNSGPLNTGSGCVLLNGIQFYDGTFGDGSDGTVVLDGSTTFNNFSSLAGSTYTLTRDVFATNLTVNNTVTLKPAGYRIFCLGGFTNNGTVNADGNAGSGINGGATTGNGTIIGGRAGGAGGATGVNNGSAPAANDAAGGVGAGGAGGAGTSGGTGGAGATSISSSAAPYRIVHYALTGWSAYFVANGSAQAFSGSAGGGGGGGGSTGNGGGGGSGGGPVVIFAWSAVNGGTITAKGGNGGNATGNGGAGGPGSGGKIIIYTLSAWTPGTATVTAGSAGTGAGSPGTGAAGLVLNVLVA